MSKLFVSEGYLSRLSAYETRTAIGGIKRIFEDNLSRGLKLKYMAHNKYVLHVGEGLYTEITEVRRDVEPDNLHSVYVKRWDWEKLIDSAFGNEDSLRRSVSAVVNAICDTADKIKELYPALSTDLSRNVRFITMRQLEDIYPELTSQERENAYLKECKTAFILHNDETVKSSAGHEEHVRKNDAWALYGNLVFWNDVSECAMRVASIGLRAYEESSAERLREPPFTMGGRIGQSRLCMLLLQKAHIGEV